METEADGAIGKRQAMPSASQFVLPGGWKSSNGRARWARRSLIGTHTGQDVALDRLFIDVAVSSRPLSPGELFEPAPENVDWALGSFMKR